jgi:ATP-dependent RNA helicase RhlE
MGFIRDIRRILMALPSKRQNLFFSATFTQEIRGLADSFLQSPVEVAVAKSTVTADLISQIVHPVDKDRKRAVLEHLINAGDWRQVLVFTRTKHGANRLAEQLDTNGIRADAIHGNKSQPQRTRALAQFKLGKVRVLVATDIAARGLDIEQLPHVVNFELPNVPEDYIHRIGRTGRAGSSGQAVSLVCSEEGDFLRDIERLLKRSIERVVIEGFQPTGAPLRKDGASAASRQRRPQQRQPSGRPSVQGQGARNNSSGDGRRSQGSAVGRQGRSAVDRQRSANPGRRGDAQPSHNSNRSISSLLGGNR